MQFKGDSPFPPSRSPSSSPSLQPQQPNDNKIKSNILDIPKSDTKIKKETTPDINKKTDSTYDTINTKILKKMLNQAKTELNEQKKNKGPKPKIKKRNPDAPHSFQQVLSSSPKKKGRHNHNFQDIEDPASTNTLSYQKKGQKSTNVFGKNIYSLYDSGFRIKKEIIQEDLRGMNWLGKSQSWADHVVKSSRNVWYNQLIILIILAIFVSIIAFFASSFIQYGWLLLDTIYFNDNLSIYLRLFLCLVIKLVYCVISIYLAVNYAPEAIGAGVPELKAILNGVWIRRFFSMRVLVVKVVAIGLSLATTFPIGAMGVFMHISGAVVRQLTKIPIFSHLDRRLLLSAACAVGVSVMNNAPVGGVLFSIELTHHYYQIDAYWAAMCCATFATVFVVSFSVFYPTALSLNTNFTSTKFQSWEFIIFALLGVAAGFTAIFYIKLHQVYFYIKAWLRRTNRYNPYITAVVIATSYIIITFALGEFMFRPSRIAIMDLFTVVHLEECGTDTVDCEFSDWGLGLGITGNLIFFSVLNFIYSPAFILFDWPCGVFSAVFSIGASGGRLVGEFLTVTVLQHRAGENAAASYSLIGAAALTSAVTGTISPGVIALELTKSTDLLAPVMLAVVIGWGITSKFVRPIYDNQLYLRNIPLLPSQPSQSARYDVDPPRPYIAMDFVDTNNFSYLNERTTLREIAIILETCEDFFFPIVHDRTLIGEVSRLLLEDILISKGFLRGSDQRNELMNKKDFYNYNNNNEIFNDNDNDKIKIEFNDDDKKKDNNLEDSDDEYPDDDDDNNNNDDKNNNDKKNKKNVLLEDEEYDYVRVLERKVSALDLHDNTAYDKEEDEEMKLILTDEPWITHLNLSPVQVIPTMPLSEIYTLFHVLHPDKLYVTKRNELIGVITEGALIEFERNYIKSKSIIANIQRKYNYISNLLKKCMFWRKNAINLDQVNE